MFSLLFYSMHFTFIIIYPLKTKLIKVFKKFQTLTVFLFISNIITLYVNSVVFVKNSVMVLYIVNIYKCFLYNFITDLEKLYILKLLVVCVLVAQLCPILCDTVACQASPTNGFSRQEYWNGLPFPSPGNLPNPGIKPGSRALEADALTSEPPEKPKLNKQTKRQR